MAPYRLRKRKFILMIHVLADLERNTRNAVERNESLVMVKNPEDIEKVYEMGFECIGHPTEVVKYISEEEYESWNTLQAR